MIFQSEVSCLKAPILFQLNRYQYPIRKCLYPFRLSSHQVFLAYKIYSSRRKKKNTKLGRSREYQSAFFWLQLVLYPPFQTENNYTTVSSNWDINKYWAFVHAQLTPSLWPRTPVCPSWPDASSHENREIQTWLKLLANRRFSNEIVVIKRSAISGSGNISAQSWTSHYLNVSSSG